ncbi:MAG: hypothetical protein K8H88_33485 [Sandaracinaceae bacterium]|nr:hypothetical protein [Sandaracinaceae bacterium]
MPSPLTVRFSGRTHLLTPREERASGFQTSWARELIEDPRAQHYVHLLLDELVGPDARLEWSELLLLLEETLTSRYECTPAEAPSTTEDREVEAA